MATLDDVRGIALRLPEVFEQPDGHRGGATWRTKRGLVVWERMPSKTDLAQLDELDRSWPPGPVAALHVDDASAKEALLSGYPDVFFTIPHFAGYPAILVRLEAVDIDLLRELIVEAWLARVPKRLAEQWLAEQGLGGE